MKNLLLLKRYSKTSALWGNLVKSKTSLTLTTQELLTKYAGFEGESIYFSEITSINNFKEKINELLELKKSEHGRLFFITDIDEDLSLFPLHEHAHKVGYEVGTFDDDDSFFSSIFHEILFGKLEELTHFTNLLNKNLLFPDVSTAKNYIKEHSTLSQLGKSVEDYMPLKIYEIWECL